MHASPLQLLHAHHRHGPVAPALPCVLVAGGTGALGNEVLRRMASGMAFREVQVLARRPMATMLRTVSPLQVAGEDIDHWPPAVGGATVGVVMFEQGRMGHERERALWTPRPDQLPALARWLQRSGIHTVAIVLPHDQGRLPAALRAGLASLDEQAVAALGFDCVLLVRSARKPGGPRSGAPVLERLAHWLLSNAHFMLPQAERPVGAAKVAELVDMALRLAPRGIHGASPEMVWRAAQQDLRETVTQWLRPEGREL